MRGEPYPALRVVSRSKPRPGRPKSHGQNHHFDVSSRPAFAVRRTLRNEDLMPGNGADASDLSNPSRGRSSLGPLIGALFLALTLCSRAIGDDSAAAAIPNVTAPAGAEHRHPTSRPDSAKRSGASDTSSAFVWPLIGILPLLACGAWCVWIRRGASPASGLSGRLSVLGRMPISARHGVAVVTAGDRRFLVGYGPQGAPQLLAELDSEPNAPEPTRLQESSSFRGARA